MAGVASPPAVVDKPSEDKREEEDVVTDPLLPKLPRKQVAETFALRDLSEQNVIGHFSADINFQENIEGIYNFKFVKEFRNYFNCAFIFL